MLEGKWTNYERAEDGILKRAYMSGHKKAKYTLRGKRYECDFIGMKQKNLETARERDIRPPPKLKPPSKPLVPSGPTLMVKVPPHTPGTLIQIPHPSDKSEMICVEVPNRARAGQTMIVPIPPLGKRPVSHIPTPGRQYGGAAARQIPTPSAPPAPSRHIPAPSAPPAPAVSDSTETKKCGKGFVAGGALAGGAIAGAIIGEALEPGAMDDIIDAADIAVQDAGGWIEDAGHDAGDFIYDLF